MFLLRRDPLVSGGVDGGGSPPRCSCFVGTPLSPAVLTEEARPRDVLASSGPPCLRRCLVGPDACARPRSSSRRTRPPTASCRWSRTTTRYESTCVRLTSDPHCTQVDDAAVTPEIAFKDLSLDSLDAVELVMAIEEEFAIEIPDAEADKILSIPDAVEYIMAHPQAK